MVEQKIDVVTIGESMVLFQPFSEGKMAYVPMFLRTVAGAESNVGIGLSRLGKKVRWISRLGNDPFGEMIISTLRGEGLDVSHVIIDESAPTGIFFKEFKGYGDPNVYYYRKHSAASRFSVQDIRDEWFVDARHLHVTGITPALGENTAEFMEKTIKRAKQHHLTVSFDPNLRRKLWSEEDARRTLLLLVPLCDIFLPGLDEAEFLLGKLSLEEYGRLFLEMGVKVVVIKLGPEGAVAFAGNQRFRSAAKKISRIVDTVGAGDAFAAGFLSVLLDRSDVSLSDPEHWIEPALNRANAMGAFATQYKGDWEGLPTLKEIEQFLSNEEKITR